jgi:hypothetical protein
MKHNNPDKLLHRISQEFYHINRVLESCYTKAHWTSAQNWVNSIIDNWDVMFADISQSVYNKKYKETISYIFNSLDTTFKNAFKRFEEEKNTDHIIEVKGFR